MSLHWGPGARAAGAALNRDIAHYALANGLWGFAFGAFANLPTEWW